MMTALFSLFLLSGLSLGKNQDLNDTTMIVGFDCNRTNPEIRTFSTLSVSECPIPQILNLTQNTIVGQIVQRRSLRSIHVLTCHVFRSIHFTHCGMHFHASIVDGPRIKRPFRISRQKCLTAHQQHVISLEGSDSIPIPKSNTTVYHSQSIVGWASRGGYCEGGSFTLEGITYKNVVVYGDYVITILDHTATYDSDSSKINILSTVSCGYKDGECHDDLTGSHYWNIEEKVCEKSEWDVLYEGPVTEVLGDGVPTIVIKQEPYLLYSAKGYQILICGQVSYSLDYIDLFFVPQREGHFIMPKQQRTPELQLITYFNAKIAFAHHQLQDEIKIVFAMLQVKLCEIERKILRHQLELMRLIGKKSGLQGLGFPGSYAQSSGEVIHVIKCEPVGVTLRTTSQCHADLPIQYRDKNFFLQPGSHIILAHSAIEPCSLITPAKFFILGSWIEASPQFRKTSQPLSLSPSKYDAYPGETIKSLAKGGIYSEADILSLQKSMMFPNLRDTILSDMAGSITSVSDNQMYLRLDKVMGVEAKDALGLHQVKKVWGWLGEFGVRASGFVAILFIIQLTFGLLSMIVNFSVLKKSLGFTAWMLCCCFNSCTMLAISHQKDDSKGVPGTFTSWIYKKIAPKTDSSECDIPLQEVVTDTSPPPEDTKITMAELESLASAHADQVVNVASAPDFAPAYEKWWIAKHSYLKAHKNDVMT